MSFLAFCAVNVVIDVESMYNMLTRAPRVHTFLHTYVDATLAAVSAGALIGAWSHVFLDSIMHSDITPLAPFSSANSLHGAISLRALHLACVVAGVVGLAWWLWLTTRRELED